MSNTKIADSNIEHLEADPIASGLVMPDEAMYTQAQDNIEQLPAYTVGIALDELRRVDADLDVIEELEAEGATREQLKDDIIAARARYGSVVLEILRHSPESSEDATTPESAETAKPITLSKNKLSGTIKSLREPEGEISLSVVEVVTENGVKFRLCDLRPEMTSSVRKASLIDESRESEALTAQVIRDMSLAAETGTYTNTVTQANDLVAYSKLGGTNVRGYWMPVPIELNDGEKPDGVMTFVRIADCGNDVGGEIDLYRRVFGYTLRK